MAASRGDMSRARVAEFPIRGPILLLAVVAAVYLSRALLIPLSFALTLAFSLAPAVERLEKSRMPRALAVAAVGVVASAAFFLGAYVLSRQAINVAQTLPGYRVNVQRKMAALHSPAEDTIERAFGAVEEMGGDFVLGSARTAPATTEAGSTSAPAQPEMRAVPVRAVDGGRSSLEGTGELALRVLKPIGEVGVVVIFTIYMLMKREELRHRLLLLAGMGHLNVMSRALEDATARISRYLIMQIEVNACYGLLFGAGLFLIGVPNATLWGMIAAVFRIVPYVGTMAALVFPLVVSIAVSTSWWPPLLVVAVFLLLETTAANFVEPWLYSSRTGISSLALLATAIFWTMIWGWPGLVLSTPLTVCMVVLGRYVPQMEFLNILLGTNAELSPPAHYYERLLAMNEREAREIAEQYLEGKPLAELYDSVVIPALSLAEEDRHKGALEDVRSNFVFLSVGELVARLNGYRQGGIAVSDKSELSLKLEELRHPTPSGFPVVCISASDRADELTTIMLTQLMERAGHPTLLLTSDAVSEDILSGLAQEPSTVVVISALPPFAFAEVQAIFEKVRLRMKTNRVVVGLWNTSDDAEDLGQRFGSSRPDCVVRTLADALRRVAAWHQASRNAPLSG